MGFSSIDDVVAKTTSSGQAFRREWSKSGPVGTGTVGRWYSTFTWPGNPPAGTYSGSALTAVQMSDATAGAMDHGGNVSTATKHVLNASAMTTAATGVPGVLILVDLLLYYPGINLNSTSSQSLTNGVSLPRYTSGAGVQMFLETTTATAATSHNYVTWSYTNSASTSGRALAPTVNQAAVSPIGSIEHSGTSAGNVGPLLPLAAGDLGVKSVQSVQFSAAAGASAAGALVLCKPLMRIPLTAAGIPTLVNPLFDMPPMPQIQDGACLSWLYYAGAATVAATPFNGNLDVGWS